jgi:hypothetical protein
MFAQRTTIRNVELNHAVSATVNRPAGALAGSKDNIYLNGSRVPAPAIRA